MLQSMGLQRVSHDLLTDQQQQKPVLIERISSPTCRIGESIFITSSPPCHSEIQIVCSFYSTNNLQEKKRLRKRGLLILLLVSIVSCLEMCLNGILIIKVTILILKVT